MRRPKDKPKPKYHVIIAHGKATRRATWTGSIVTLYKQTEGALVRYIPLNKEAWNEVDALANEIDYEEVYDYGIE